MLVRHTIAALSIAAAGGLVAPAAAAAPVELRGVTVVSGSRAGYADVRVPRTIRLATPFGGGPDVAVTGGAALAAIVLVGRDAATRNTTIVGGASTVDGQSERFLFPVPQWPALGGGTYEDTKTYGDETLLPAGRYRLYFVASGPAAVTLRLRGLTGKRSVVPRGRVAAAVEPPDHELSGNPVRENVFAASNSRDFARPGFALQVLQSKLEGEAAWQVVMCHNNPANSVAAPLRDAPGCPSGEKHTLVNHRYPGVTPDWKLFAQAFAGLPAGEHGLSTIYTSEAYATAIGYSTLWLEY